MQAVAAAVALLMLARFRDALFVAPIAWALFAIASQQDAGGYPGDARVALAARLLGAALALAAAAAAALRAAACGAGRTKFAPEVVRLPGGAAPLLVPLLAWVAEVDAAGAAAATGKPEDNDVGLLRAG